MRKFAGILWPPANRTDNHTWYSDAEGRIDDCTGCNRLTGTYQLDGKALKFSPLAMTKMACPPPLDAQERAFIQAINATASVRESGNILELLDAGGKVQMRLQAR